MSKSTWGSGSIYRQPNGRFWWISYYVRGKRYCESSKSVERQVAARLLKKRIQEAAGGKRPIGAKAERITLADLFAGVSDSASNRRALYWLQSFFGEHKRAIDLTYGELKKYTAARKQQLIRRNGVMQPPANGSINRELAALRKAFSAAVRNQALTRELCPIMPMLEEAPARQGFLTPEQFEPFYAALPEDLKDFVRFLYFSSWRCGAARALEWRDVEWEFSFSGEPSAGTIRLRSELAKNRQAQSLPLAGELLEIVKRQFAKRLPDCPFIFHRANGGQIKGFRKAWRNACKAAGLEGLIPHDLRRSGIRNLLRARVDERIAMSISGHLTRSVFDRYAITDDENKGAAMTQVSSYHRERSAKIIPFPNKRSA